MNIYDRYYNSSIDMFPKNKLITKLAYNEYHCLNYLRKSIFDVISFDFTAKDVECYLY